MTSKESDEKVPAMLPLECDGKGEAAANKTNSKQTINQTFSIISSKKCSK